MLRLLRTQPVTAPRFQLVSEVVFELRGFLLIGGVVSALVLVGIQAQAIFQTGVVGTVWAQGSGVGVSQSAPDWLPAFSWLQIESKNPWEIGVEELTWERVAYNLVTKPGYRWLLLEVAVLGVSLLVLYKAMSLAVSLQRRMPKVAEVSLDENDPGALVVELAGTVKIIAKRGVIFGGEPGMSGEQEYASYIDWWPRIRIGRA